MSLYNLANGELKNENDKLKIEIKRKIDEIYDLKKTKNKLKKQLEAYENMRKEAIKLIDYYGITPEQNDNVTLRHILKDLSNILNKVGEDNE